MDSIRVFAHHDAEDRLRWRTLIQVGDDWTIRGTVFMKNPGSSKPIDADITDALDELNRIDDSAKWYGFSVDQTMSAIISLFRLRAESRRESFSGVIQVFNLINTMSPDITEGVRLYKSSDHPLKTTIGSDIANTVSPVYIGWGAFCGDSCVSELADQIIDAVGAIEDITYLHEAKFPHPLYLMRYGANKPVCLNVKKGFCRQ